MLQTNRLIIILTLSFAWFFSFSQEKDVNQLISPAGDTVTIQPIQLSEITSNIEQAYSTIRKIEGRLEPDPVLASFDSLYKIKHLNLLREKERLTKEEEFNSVRTLDDTKEEWINHDKLLTEWKELITTRITTLEQDLFDVNVLKARWTITRTNAREGGVPSAVLTSVSDLIKKVNNLEKEIKNNQTEALRKQNNITELSLIIDQVLTLLEDTRKNMQSEYFRIDSPPIWKSADSTAQLGNVRVQVSKSFRQNLDGIKSFYKINKDTFILHIIILLVLWLLYYLLYKEVLKKKDETNYQDLDKAQSVIARYGMSALIVSLFMSIWLYPTMTTAVNDLLQFLYIIIAIVFLPGYIDKRLRPILLALLGLFFLNEIQLFFYGKVFFARLMLFFENFLAAWILYKIIAPKGFISKELKRSNWTILLRLTPIFFIFLAGSLVGNIFGLVDLALLLDNTVVNALLNAVLLILAVIVVNQTIAILLRTPFMQSSNIIKNHLGIIEKRLVKIVQVIGIFLWLKSILKLLGLYVSIYDWFNEAIKTSWEIGETGTTIDLGNIINFFLVIIITILTYKLVSAILKEDVFPRIKLPRGIPGTITTVVTYFIVGYGLFIAISSVVNLGQFGLIAGALGVGIGFGLQGIVANFIAGLVLAFERPIQDGDTIEVGTMMGVVLSIGVRSTTIRTFDGSEVIIPNSDLITKDVINWTLTDRRKRRDIHVNVAYGSNPHDVLDLIRKVANDHPDVLKVPAPWALFDGFGDSSLNFRIRIWTTMDNGMTVTSEVAINIYDALQEAGIEIPFPQSDLHLRSVDPGIQELSVQKQKPITKKRRTKPKPILKKETDRKFEDDPDESDDS